MQSAHVASKPGGNNRNRSSVTLRKSCFGSFGLLNQIWFANQFWFHKPNLVWSEPNLVWSGNPKPNLVWQKWTRIGLGLSQKLKVWFCRCIIHRKQHLRSSSNQKWFSERDFVWAQPKVKSSRFCRARNQRNQLDTSFFSACGRNFVICVFYTKPEIFTFFTLNPKFSQNNTNTRGPPTYHRIPIFFWFLD